MMKNLKKQASSHEDRFQKTLFALSRCRITEDNGSRDLLSRSQMHVDEWNEVTLTAQQRRRRKTSCVGGSWLFVVTSSVAAARIYREDPPRATTSRNRLRLSLSKRIRHGLVVKINSKMMSWTCKALGRISVDYSHARRAPAPITTPRPARPDEASECACMFLSFYSPPHTCMCIESNPPYK
jgi:hypothetical protein